VIAARWLLSLVLVASSACCFGADATPATTVFDHPKSAEELAKTLLAQPAKEIANTQVLRGRFVHRKYLTEIPTPLEATGEFMFLREQGLYWHTLKPFESVFVLTPQSMTQQDEGGKSFKMDAAEQPAVRAAAQIFMALFAVDLKALDRDFRLFGMASGAGWRLGLRPKSNAMSSVFSEAIVSGASQVEQVELRDAHGDRTVIQLLDPQLLSRPPTPAERALLGH
jgi:hypothetical protein